jgi:spore coat protein U-like protein
MRRLTRLVPLVAGVSLLVASASAMAACTIDTRPVAFGVVDVTRDNDANGEITLDCTIATEIEVGITGNTAPGQRFMTGPSGGRLTYELYPDATRALPWGDGAGNSTTRRLTTGGEETTRLTIYGIVPKQDSVPPGAYSDALIVQVSF